MRLLPFHYLLGLLELAAGLGAGQPRPQGIGFVPGTAVPATAGRPDVVVARSRGVAVAGVLPAGTGLRATYHAAGVPRGKAACVRINLGVTWRGRPPRAYRASSRRFTVGINDGLAVA